MKIMVACERSGIVRSAFEQLGHDVWSVDLEDTLLPGQHLKMDVVDALKLKEWDMLIAHPPCQYVSYAGARWWNVKPGWKDEQQKALMLFSVLWKSDIEHICIENPRGLPMSLIARPSDVIQPYEFGHDVSKRTYLWLKNLPPLMKTLVNPNFKLGWTENANGFARSRTFQGIASAMAAQWSSVK